MAMNIDNRPRWAREIAPSESEQYRASRVQIGQRFRIAQQEANNDYLYCEMAEATQVQQELADAPAATSVEKFVETAVRRISIFMKGFAPEPLTASAAAGVPKMFPREQHLPSVWFKGADVTLQFEYKPSGVWYVGCNGAPQELLLYLHSDAGELLSLPLRIGHTKARLPLDLTNLNTIEVGLVDDDESKD